MKTTLLRAGALACALLTTTALTAPASAQTARTWRQPDANGVDLTYGDFSASVREGSIGSGEAELALDRSSVWVPGTFPTNGAQWDRIQFTQLGSTYAVVIGARSEAFSGTGTIYSGSSLSGSDGSFTYTRGDGTQIGFSDPSSSVNPASNFCNGSGQTNCTLLPVTITSPDGKTVALDWEIWTQFRNGGQNNAYFARIGAVTNSYGYRIQFAYSSGGSFSTSSPPPSSWYQRTGATFYNDAVSTTTPQASVSYSYPSSGVTDVTDIGGNVWRLTGGYDALTAIRRPGASSDTTTVSYGGSGGTVSSVARDGVTTGYSRSVSGSTATMTITDAASHVTTVVSDLTVGRPTSITDPLSRPTSFQYDSYGRLTRITLPEGNYTAYTYDGRGNVTEVRRVAKPGSALADIVTSATYPTYCSEPSCNVPLTTTDARGNVTDYAYDSTHGGVLSVTRPPPGGSGTRPESRYSYTLTNGEYRLTGISVCATSDTASGCVGTSDESRSVIAYDANGNVTSVQRRSGNSSGAGALSVTTGMTYDALGNLVTVDGPLSGSDDLITYRYNAGRQLVGVVRPDPDGSGITYAHRPARRVTYTNALPTRVEAGTVNGLTDTDWAGFTTLQQVDTTYDANARPTRQRLSASSNDYAVSDFSYDSLGRPDCTAVRMNPSQWGTTTAACTLQTVGSYGDDRITRTAYDNAGQVTLVQTGYGVTGVQADEVATTYGSNGQVETVTDAMSNRTTYVYDGHDRLSQTRYPSATQGAATSNSSDYEQLTYTTATVGGNPVSTLLVSNRRLRDNTNIAFTYDNLGRLSTRDTPNAAYGDFDTSYSYDLLGRPTSLAASTGTYVNSAYDALGRMTSRTINAGTYYFQYDSIGHMTRMTWPDGFYAGYDYDFAGQMTSVRENGATSGAGVLAIYAYDDLGRRTGLTRGNGTIATYSFDNASRLTQLQDNLAGTTYDETVTLSYNPAGGIVSSTRSNDAYAWLGHYAVNRNYATNGLNQYTASGPATLTYDGRGNLSSDGTHSFTHTAENRLAQMGSSIFLSHDAAGWLSQVSGSTNILFDAPGGSIVSERDGSYNLQHRYVYGAGGEPLVWYYVGDTTPRRWLHSDERGSVVAVTNDSGTAIAINSYDEHGIPNPVNSGRFQYTGQAWLPDIGMYYYRNRIYSPTLGRFLETDPIGFEGGMNLYAYVSGDPINSVDPLGLREICWNADNTHWEQNSSGGTIVVESKHVCMRVADWAMTQPGPPIGWDRSVPSPTEHTSPDRQRACGQVPPAPPGVSIDNIVQAGRSFGDDLNFINDIGFVYNNFGNHSGMDFKQINAHPGSESPFENFGNFAFGAFTYAMSIPESIALAGAGVAQIRSGNAQLRDIVTDFDDPVDQQQILNGRHYAECMLGH